MIQIKGCLVLFLLFISCFSWRFTYRLTGQLTIEKGSESNVIYAYDEFQNDIEDQYSKKQIDDETEIIIKKAKKIFKMVKGKPDCTEEKQNFNMLDFYKQVEASLTVESPPILHQGLECTCFQSIDKLHHYCNHDFQPCYFETNLNYLGENTTFKLSATSFREFKDVEDFFEPDYEHFCPELGTPTATELEFPHEFSGVIYQTLKDHEFISEVRFSVNESLAWLNSKLINFKTGILVENDKSTGNLLVSPLSFMEKLFIECDSEYYKPKLVFNQLGHTIPGYKFMRKNGVTRMTAMNEEYIHNYMVKKEGEITEVLIFQKPNYIMNHFRLYGPANLRQDHFEYMDLGVAMMMNNSDTEIILQFSTESAIVPSLREVLNLRHEISDAFDEEFKAAFPVNRVMARRVEINYNTISFYAKIVRPDFFNHLFQELRMNTTEPAFKTATALSIKACYEECNRIGCLSVYFKGEPKDNCLLYMKYLKKSVVKPDPAGLFAYRLTMGGIEQNDDIRKKIESQIKQYGWSFDVKLVETNTTAKFNATSTWNQITTDAMIALSEINDIKPISYESLSVQKFPNIKTSGNMINLGRFSLKKCIDAFFYNRQHVDSRYFNYDSNTFNCFLVVGETSSMDIVPGFDSYYFDPTRTFKKVEAELNESGYIGEATFDECCEVCLKNSLEFLHVKVDDAKLTVPFNKSCTGVQVGDKKCYMVFNALKTNSSSDLSATFTTFKRDLKVSFDVILETVPILSLDNIGIPLDDNYDVYTKCFEELGNECRYIVKCQDPEKKISYFANKPDFNIINFGKGSPQGTFKCDLLANVAMKTREIVKTEIVKVEKLRSLSKGGVVGLSIGLIVVGVVLGLLVGKYVVNRN